MTTTVADNEALFKTGYSRKVTWVDRIRDLIVKEEYYDDQGHHLKTMMADKVEQVDGFWTVTMLGKAWGAEGSLLLW